MARVGAPTLAYGKRAAIRRTARACASGLPVEQGSGHLGTARVVDADEQYLRDASLHLKILIDAGILTRYKRGAWAYYTLVPDALNALGAVLTTTRNASAAGG